MEGAGPDIELPCENDANGLGIDNVTAVIAGLWDLPAGALLESEEAYPLLRDVLLGDACITVSMLARDSCAQELVGEALVLLLRHQCLNQFLVDLRSASLERQCMVLSLLCTLPSVQEHVVTPMIMELWNIDRILALRALLLIGYPARTHALALVLEFLAASATFDHNSIRSQQDLLASVLMRLFAFQQLCDIIEDERGHRGFRIACLHALNKSIRDCMGVCRPCKVSNGQPWVLCPHATKVSVVNRSHQIATIVDDVIHLCLDELYIYLDFAAPYLTLDNNQTKMVLGTFSSVDFAIPMAKSREQRASGTSMLCLGDLENHTFSSHKARRSRSNSGLGHRDHINQLERSLRLSASPFCQAQTLTDQGCLLLMTSLEKCMKSANEGVVSCAIVAMTSILNCLVDTSLVDCADLAARLKALNVIRFIEGVFSNVEHPKTAVKEVTVISLGTILIDYWPYIHRTVTLGLFYSIFTLALSETHPRVCNFCFLTIKYIYCNSKSAPHSLLIKQSDVQKLINVFITSASLKNLIAECICLTNSMGRQFLMQTAQKDTNTRNRTLCIGALKCVAISVLEESEFIDLKRFLTSILLDTNTLVQMSAIDLYGYLYYLSNVVASDALAQRIYKRPEFSLESLATSSCSFTAIEMQRINVFASNPVITHSSFVATLSSKLCNLRICQSEELRLSILRVVQEYADKETACNLLVDAILTHKQHEKVINSLLNLFVTYHPLNIRGYARLFQEILDIQTYKRLDRRFPYESDDLKSYTIELLRTDSDFREVVSHLANRRRGSLNFTEWCNHVLSLIDDGI